MDKTTLKRFEYSFDKESEIREAYHISCDKSLRVTKECLEDIESQVKDWLDNNGVESPQFELHLKKDENDKDLDWILFQRSEIAIKTASNNWKIFHIAYSGFWPRLISSKPKLLIQKSAGEFVRFENEIRSLYYSNYEAEKTQLANNILKEEIMDGSESPVCGHKL